MKWASDKHRSNFDALVKKYGGDALISELARRAEGNASKDDPAGAAIVQTFASELRAAMRRRDEARSLVSYRRDWPEDQWVRWLASEAERENLTLHHQWAAALLRAGCADPVRPALTYALRKGAEAISDKGGNLPADREQWARYLAARESEVAHAKSVADLAMWLVAHGHPEQDNPGLTLTEHRDLLPASVRSVVPAPTRKADPAEARTKGPAPAPEDTSMFTPPEGD